MNIRQLLKPDWRKIIIFLVLLLPLFYPDSIIKFQTGWDYAMRGNRGGAPILENLFWIWIFLLFEPSYELPKITFILLTVIVFIISYLLSCLIVWIYDKFRKRKLKKV
jgi:hypothetical protein